MISIEKYNVAFQQTCKEVRLYVKRLKGAVTDENNCDLSPTPLLVLKRNCHNINTILLANPER